MSRETKSIHAHKTSVWSWIARPKNERRACNVSVRYCMSSCRETTSSTSSPSLSLSFPLLTTYTRPLIVPKLNEVSGDKVRQPCCPAGTVTACPAGCPLTVQVARSKTFTIQGLDSVSFCICHIVLWRELTGTRSTIELNFEASDIWRD